MIASLEFVGLAVRVLGTCLDGTNASLHEGSG